MPFLHIIRPRMCERMAGQNIRNCSGVLCILARYVASLPKLSGSSSIEEHLVINVTVCLYVLSVFGVVMTMRSFSRAAIPQNELTRLLDTKTTYPRSIIAA